MTDIPNGWELKRLSDLLEKLKSGKKAERGWSPQCLSHPSTDESVWGVLKTTSVQMGEFLPEYNKELPKSLEPKSGLEVNSGDFLVTTTGPRNRCGIVCHVKRTRKKLIFSGKILRFRVNESLILPNLLMYQLMSPEYQSILDKMKVGTSDSSVSIGNQQILDLEILVPPLPEQHKIVEILEDHLSRLDAALAGVKQAKVKAAQFRRSLLQAAFTGNLGSDGSRLMTDLPEGWAPRRLSELVTFNRKKPISLKSSPELVSFVPMPKVSEIINKINLDELISHEEGQRRSLTYFENGDVIFAKITPCMENGKIAITSNLNNGRAYGSTEFHVLSPGPEISADYLFYFVVSDDFRSNAAMSMTGAVGQRRVPKSYLEDQFIPLPPLPEQHKIIEILEDHLSRLDASIALADAMEKQSAGLRRSLLQAAFTGQLTKEVASV